MTTIIQVLAVIGFAVIALLAIGLAVTFLVLGAMLLERLTGVPADQRRPVLETPVEYRARLAAQTLAELIDAEEQRRASQPVLVVADVVSLEGWRASRHPMGGGAA